MKYFIKADRFVLRHEEKINGFLQVENGRFGLIIDEIPDNSEVVDWSGFTVAPGMFDTHIHGINGYDIMDGCVEAVHAISEALLKIGVTRFLPTTLTSSQKDLNVAITAVVKSVKQGLPGAQSEGIFLEGPYFTDKYKGAQNPSYFRDPDYIEFKEWQNLAEGSIVKIALAPERTGAQDFIRTVSNEGILITLAHTNASYECCVEALNAGARNFAHLFNGMAGLHHREPGVAGAALYDERAYAEIICDGYHVHPHVTVLAERLKSNKLILITDCMRAGLKPDGTYLLGEFPITLLNGIAKTEAGSLAGSTLRLIDGVKNLKSWSGKSLYEIWHYGSLSPAMSLGRDSELGSIESGKIADYVVLNNDLEVQATAIAGEVKYKKD